MMLATQEADVRQVQFEGERAAAERLPGFDHELRRAAARMGIAASRPSRGSKGALSEPPRGTLQTPSILH